MMGHRGNRNPGLKHIEPKEAPLATLKVLVLALTAKPMHGWCNTGGGWQWSPRPGHDGSGRDAQGHASTISNYQH